MERLCTPTRTNYLFIWWRYLDATSFRRHFLFTINRIRLLWFISSTLMFSVNTWFFSVLKIFFRGLRLKKRQAKLLAKEWKSAMLLNFLGLVYRISRLNVKLFAWLLAVLVCILFKIRIKKQSCDFKQVALNFKHSRNLCSIFNFIFSRRQLIFVFTNITEFHIISSLVIFLKTCYQSRKLHILHKNFLDK